MKGFPTFLILATALVLASCGKNNESGRNSGICTQYVGGNCSAYSSFNPGMSGEINLSQVVNQIPCIYGNMGRSQVTVQVQTASRTTPGQQYLGTTALGDIAIIIGNGSMTTQATLFLCGGQMGGYNPGMGMGGYAKLGEYTTMSCPIKTITEFTYGNSFFRTPAGGIGLPPAVQPYSFCR